MCLSVWKQVCQSRGAPAKWMVTGTGWFSAWSPSWWAAECWLVKTFLPINENILKLTTRSTMQYMLNEKQSKFTTFSNSKKKKRDIRSCWKENVCFSTSEIVSEVCSGSKDERELGLKKIKWKLLCFTLLFFQLWGILYVDILASLWKFRFKIKTDKFSRKQNKTKQIRFCFPALLTETPLTTLLLT